MISWLKRAAAIVLLLLTLPVLAAAVVLLVANTDPGRRFIQQQTANLTGGMVRIQGLAGRFPDALRAGQIQVSDAKGPYVTISNMTLDWSPLKLLARTARFDRLHAERVDFNRLPESSGATGNSSFDLPVRVDLRRLDIDRAVIGASIAGTAATLAVYGSAELPSLTEGAIQLDVRRLDSPGQYAVNGRVRPDGIQAAMKADEPAKGLISTLVGLPDLGPIAFQASVDGPRDALAARMEMTAGPLTASAFGAVDLDHRVADMAVHAQAPAMAPSPDVSWRSVLVDATVHGPFTKPIVTGTAKIEALDADGTRVGGLTADVSGNSGQVDVHTTMTDLRLPGSRPDILASNPVTMDASVRLDATDRPVTFKLQHPLATVDGTALTKGVQQIDLHLVLPNLSPFAATGGVDIDGNTDLEIHAERKNGATSASANGRVAITGGIAPLPALIGGNGRIDLAASLHGQDITLLRLEVNGKALHVTVHGGMTDQAIDADWTLALADLGAIQPSLSGTMDAKGHASGKLDDLAVQADIGADLAAKGYSSGHIAAKLQATGLPAAPHATISAGGTLLDAPLSLGLTADEDKGAVIVNIGQASWKSLQAGGAFSLTPPAVIPLGNLHIDFGHLGDLEPLLGRPITGRAIATLDSDDKAAKLLVTITDAAVPGSAAINKAELMATVADPTGHPIVDGTFTASGVSLGRAKSISARMTAKGPIDALAITVDADAPDVAGNPAKLASTGVLNAPDEALALTQMTASWKHQDLKLLAPAAFRFSGGVVTDRLRLGFRQAQLTVSGHAGSTLDLTATLRGLPADVGTLVDPAYAADGTITADARLTGTLSSPRGTIKLTANGVRQRSGPGRALPAANLVANVDLQGTLARIDSKVAAGSSYISVTGSAPLSKSGSLNLSVDGQVDLAMSDPILTAEGRRARGEVALHAGVTGTTSAPLANGTAELRNGDMTDYTVGAHVSGLTAMIEASGDTIRLARFSGKAGSGTLGGNGSISLAGAMPVDLHFTADNARTLSSDLMTAAIDADLTVRGDLAGDLQVGGTLHVRRADIRIPEKMPPSVAVLPVRNANAPPPPPPEPEPQSKIALKVTLNAPEQIFIRGRGLDAELGGTIHFLGTAAKPIPDGGFQLRRGTISLAGTTLTFTSGSIDFSGAGITDPSFKFVATSTTATIVATLTVSGTAKNPKFTLSSVPDMPQDEILSQLLFNTSTSKLSAFQLAQVAATLTSLSGATAGFDPLESLRNTFGLDRLSVGSNSSGNATLEAGRYLARGVYLGAKQSASGTGTQATIQVDLAKGLKLEATAGSGSTSATGSTSSADAASAGVTYQFEY